MQLSVVAPCVCVCVCVCVCESSDNIPTYRVVHHFITSARQHCITAPSRHRLLCVAVELWECFVSVRIPNHLLRVVFHHKQHAYLCISVNVPPPFANHCPFPSLSPPPLFSACGTSRPLQTCRQLNMFCAFWSSVQFVPLYSIERAPSPLPALLSC